MQLEASDLDGYMEILRRVPGVSAVRVLRPPKGYAPHPQRRQPDARITVSAGGARERFNVEIKRTHLTEATAQHLARAASAEAPLLLLAPHVGAGIAEQLINAGVNYLDLHGNCHIQAPRFLLHVEGKRAHAQPALDKGLRSAAFQILFGYLAEPKLVNATVRRVARETGTSIKAVSTMRERLLAQEFLVKTRAGVKWVPSHFDDALAMWLHGYATAVRPALNPVRLRTREQRTDVLEAQLTEVFNAAAPGWCWGGTAAAFRLTGHYRGPGTTVHLDKRPAGLLKLLQAQQDPHGNLTVLGSFGELNRPTEVRPDRVHPLLVYAELQIEPDERARETAALLLEEHIRFGWE